jgi:DNA-binding GntR family transcriptional regulator
MEKYAIQKIIERISNDDQVEEMFNKLNKIKNKFINSYNNKDVHNYAKTDAEFHINLVKMSKNKMAYSMFEKSFQNIQAFQIIPLDDEKRFEDSFKEHIKTIEGIEENNFEKSWNWNSTNLKLAFRRTLKVVSEIDKESFNNDDKSKLLELSCSRMEKSNGKFN